jgi:hypothetical protein
MYSPSQFDILLSFLQRKKQATEILPHNMCEPLCPLQILTIRWIFMKLGMNVVHGRLPHFLTSQLLKFHNNITEGAWQWCSWLRHCTTSRKVPASIPEGVGILH